MKTMMSVHFKGLNRPSLSGSGSVQCWSMVTLGNVTMYSTAGPDPEFPVGEGANPPEKGTNIQIFQKNCKKLRQFWSGWGGGGSWIHHCKGIQTDAAACR